MNIPIYIICYNNGFYVQNTLLQLKSKNIPNEQITILNNNSTGEETLKILTELSGSYNIINLNKNYGHNIWRNPIIWNKLPEYFIVTDPDLEYNQELPDNFITILYEISNTYKASKTGFALNIEASDLFNDPYVDRMTIKEWESQFWKDPLPKYKNLDIYAADIDTTFFLGCKSRINKGFNIRVASSFTCKHLPWHIDYIKTLDKNVIHEMYLINNISSTTGKIIQKYL